MDRFLTRVAVSLATLLVVVLAAVAAVLCLGAAGYLALREVLSPALTALIVGLAALVLALLVGLTGRTLSAGLRHKPKSCAASAGESELAGLLGKELAGLIRGHAPASAFAALLAGFVVGMSPGLRKALRDLLKD